MTLRMTDSARAAFLHPRRLALLGSGALLGATLLLAAGCGTPNSVAAGAPPAVSSSAAAPADPPATTTPAKTTTDPATSTTATTGDQPIPKTGTNPVVPIAGGALALVGAAALLGGWRRVRGAVR